MRKYSSPFSLQYIAAGEPFSQRITGLEPVLNPLWVALFYGETFTALSAVGAVIVVGSIVLYNVWNARQE